jgi:hypothetical protein
MRRTTILSGGSLVLSLLALGPRTVAAHGGTIGGVRDGITVPPWLVVLTGGGVVGASFLLSSFVTDRDLIDAIHGHRWQSAPSLPVRRSVTSGLGLGLFVLVVAVALLGPEGTTSNPAIVIVWVGLWSGYVMTTYFVGNSWPALNPFGHIGKYLSDGTVSYPSRVGCWPATAALLGIAWLESSSSLSKNPRVLGVIILSYGAVSVLGAGLFGSDTWSARADPISKLFRYYGAAAPLSRTSSGLELRLPGARLTELELDGLDEVGFLVALVWVTTFDGLVHTRTWTGLTETVATIDLPSSIVSVVALLGGYGLFYGVYRAASIRVQTDAPTATSPNTLARRFGPSLVPIAAGYHFAHFSTYLLSGLPLLGAALSPPFLAPITADPMTVPVWMGGIDIAAILIGHLLAVWVAHSIAFEVFPGRLQAIRSQYAPVAAMVGFTTVSLWIITQPPPAS